MNRRLLPTLCALALLSPLVLARPARAGAPDLREKVRAELLRLPYYGPFDLLSFRESNGEVTLGGEVYLAVLKKQAVEAVREVPGVTKVVDRVEVLPTSVGDDRLRRVVFDRLYSDTFLARYANPPWSLGGRGPLFRARASGGWPLPGFEPVGRYAIHVLVKGGRVALYGTVAHEAERARAGADARGVFGVLGVENRIELETGARS